MLVAKIQDSSIPMVLTGGGGNEEDMFDSILLG